MEGQTVCLFPDVFVRLRFAVFDFFHDVDVVNTVARRFSPLNNFYYQTPLKNSEFDLFGSEKYQLANLVANRD